MLLLHSFLALVNFFQTFGVMWLVMDFMPDLMTINLLLKAKEGKVVNYSISVLVDITKTKVVCIQEL